MKKFLNAFIGFAGSSENPQQMSMRFSAIILAVVSKAVSFAALAGYTFPYTDEQTQTIASSLAFVVAVIFWVYGAIRAVLNTPKVGAFLRS